MRMEKIMPCLGQGNKAPLSFQSDRPYLARREVANEQGD